MSLVNGLVAKDAHIVANLSPEQITVDTFDADLLGGRLVAQAKASAANSGIAISLSGDLKGVALQQIGAEDGIGRIAAKANVRFDAKSEGGDAATLAASLAGEAKLTVGAGEMSALSPHAVAETAGRDETQRSDNIIGRRADWIIR